MKKMLLILIMALSSCAPESNTTRNTAKEETKTTCSKSLALGTWIDPINKDTMTLSSDCSFKADNCGASGLFSGVADDFGQVTISQMIKARSATCRPHPKSTCTYAVSDHLLIFQCGGRMITFERY